MTSRAKERHRIARDQGEEEEEEEAGKKNGRDRNTLATKASSIKVGRCRVWTKTLRGTQAFRVVFFSLFFDFTSGESRREAKHATMHAESNRIGGGFSSIFTPIEFPRPFLRYYRQIPAYAWPYIHVYIDVYRTYEHDLARDENSNGRSKVARAFRYSSLFSSRNVHSTWERPLPRVFSRFTFLLGRLSPFVQTPQAFKQYELECCERGNEVGPLDRRSLEYFLGIEGPRVQLTTNKDD